MKNRIFIKLLLVSTCFCNTLIATNATELDVMEHNAEYYAERLNSNNPVDVVVVPQTIKVRGISREPLIEFENQERAMIKFKKQYAHELEILKTEFTLEDLNDTNYTEYFLAIQRYHNPDIISWEIINELLAFFDLYENKDQNQEVASTLALYVNEPKEEYLIKVDALSADYNSPLSASFREDLSHVQANARSMALPNTQAAIDYAIRHATAPNRGYTYWPNGDCTNFVSQILHASGIRMDVSGSLNPNQGWWISSNSASYSWIRADTFTRYMGRRAYYSWSSLVSTLHPGAFIATDYTGDGEVNHCAFITAKSGSYVGIAQHTDNYHAWSNTTGWPTENGKRILYNVR